MSELIEGRIPKGKKCPFSEECPLVDSCCRDNYINYQFSCGIARAFEITNNNARIDD